MVDVYWRGWEWKYRNSSCPHPRSTKRKLRLSRLLSRRKVSGKVVMIRNEKCLFLLLFFRYSFLWKVLNGFQWFSLILYFTEIFSKKDLFLEVDCSNTDSVLHKIFFSWPCTLDSKKIAQQNYRFCWSTKKNSIAGLHKEAIFGFFFRLSKIIFCTFRACWTSGGMTISWELDIRL